MESQLGTLAAKLATVIATNTATVISDRVKTAHANNNKDKTIAALEEIINDQVSDKNELIRIAQAYEQEFVTQKITEKDLEYITNSILPLVEKMLPGDKVTAGQIESLLSVETLTIMQLLGFNYKRAIGEPLTILLQKTIESKMPTDSTISQKLQLAIIELARDPEASKRYEALTGIKLFTSSAQ
ncbi:hypothetical protein CR970_04060 [Candidatus Saccharibacteria bacterium]|nr:MAG: hypothetical protein CR970_04060 [Candidatus Saccharibacteria bacterium]